MRLRTIYLGLIAACLMGCNSFKRSSQLETVAKDWCMTIRASQIIPVYPLTEDLQVGDLFLVQQSVDDQHKQYEADGFLPMDNHIARLKPGHFKTFYDRSFAADLNDVEPFGLPAPWLSGSDPNWSNAPSASFPSYSFSIEKGVGFSAAVPAQSVPIAVSLMGADADQCTITIKQARTYGIDMISLYQDVLAWEATHRDFLTMYASVEGEKMNYVRVVSRVYLTGEMDVSIGSSRGRAGSLSAGSGRPVDLVAPKAPSDANAVGSTGIADYAASIAELNELNESSRKTVGRDGAEEILPGGTVKVVAVSARAIMMHETFVRPLAIGYLGFDMAIGVGGRLGPPIPTHAVLHGRRRPESPSSLGVQLIANSRMAQAYEIVKRQSETTGEAYATQLRAELDALARLVPETWPVPVFASQRGSKTLKVQIAAESPLRSDPLNFLDITRYRSSLTLSLALLTDDEAVVEDKEQWHKATKQTLDKLQENLMRHYRLLMKANEYASQFG